MKTPREILLVQHRIAEPQLDAIRGEVVAKLNHQDTKTPSLILTFASSCLRGLNKLWQELVLPSRRIWAGLAAVWVLLAVINFAQRDLVVTRTAPAMAVAMDFREQQRLLNELFASNASANIEADRPKIFHPRPRTKSYNSFNV